MIRMNRRLSLFSGALESWSSVALHPSLKLIAKKGFIQRNGCFLLAAAADGRTNATASDFEDRTGYECFINHIHIDDYVKEAPAAQAFCFVFAVLSRWRQQWRFGTLNSIVAFADRSSSVVRFHYKRPNESWLAQDLNGYEEAILELPSSEIGFLTARRRVQRE